MKIKFGLSMGVALVAVVSAQADGWAIFDGGWRISAGGVYASPVKANLRFAPVRVTPPQGRSPDAAKALAEGDVRQFTKDSPNAYVTFANGSKINPWDYSRELNDILEPGVDHFGQTWNAWFPRSAVDGDSLVLSSYDYAEVSGYSERDVRASDDRGMPGVNVELARNLYHNEEYKFGVDLAFAVSYFFETDIFSMNRQYAAGTVNKGVWETVMDAPVGIKDPEGWHNGGYGAGTYKGPGPVFNLGTMGVRNVGRESSFYGRIHADGDYSQLDLMLLAKPYYDVFDWLRINGTVGLVVSRGEFSLHETITGTDYRQSRSRDYSEWDVHGIAGLGLQFSYDDWSLGCDFYARFLDDPVDVHDSYVHGEIEQSDWLMKVSLGYRF